MFHISVVGIKRIEFCNAFEVWLKYHNVKLMVYINFIILLCICVGVSMLIINWWMIFFLEWKSKLLTIV